MARVPGSAVSAVARAAKRPVGHSSGIATGQLMNDHPHRRPADVAAPAATRPSSPCAPPPRRRDVSPGYKWLALSNTTVAVVLATINSSIMLIAMLDIFRGIALNPLEPGNTVYPLWMILGFLIVSRVLVVSLGRLPGEDV